MTRIGKNTSIQSASIQQPETQTTANNQAVTTESKSSEAAHVASSENTWQRANLKQDGTIQQSILNHQLAVDQSYEKMKQEAEKAKEASSDQGALFGTIFGGPIIGSFIGEAAPKLSNTETKQSEARKLAEAMQKEVEELQKQMEEVQDNSFIETLGNWMTGADNGVADMSQVADPPSNLDRISERLTPKYDPDDDD
jgi:hypothetical protein